MGKLRICVENAMVHQYAPTTEKNIRVKNVRGVKFVFITSEDSNVPTATELTFANLEGNHTTHNVEH